MVVLGLFRMPRSISTSARIIVNSVILNDLCAIDQANAIIVFIGDFDSTPGPLSHDTVPIFKVTLRPHKLSRDSACTTNSSARLGTWVSLSPFHRPNGQACR